MLVFVEKVHHNNSIQIAQALSFFTSMTQPAPPAETFIKLNNRPNVRAAASNSKGGVILCRNALGVPVAGAAYRIHDRSEVADVGPGGWRPGLTIPQLRDVFVAGTEWFRERGLGLFCPMWTASCTATSDPWFLAIQSAFPELELIPGEVTSTPGEAPSFLWYPAYSGATPPRQTFLRKLRNRP